MIRHLYDEKCIRKWSEIQKIINSKLPEFGGYSSKKLKERYYYFLQEGISKESWKIEEDIALLKLIEKEGKKWRHLTQYF